jgi:hypothetical protein|tara:strand:+ start:294 stop:584 length:291 start_codon:yes stop_codon:yes gene_type:complete
MNIEQEFFGPEHIAHLMDIEDIADRMHQLKELEGVIQQLSSKAGRRLEKVKNHMNQRGVCLSKMISSGQLIPLHHYWAMGPMMGRGRLPKFHRQLN